MKNILIILSLLLLVSCEWDYIHENPKHSQEYIGEWNVDSMLVNGINTPFNYFGVSIYQETMEFSGNVYRHWEIKKEAVPNKLIGMDVVDVPEIVFEVVKTPVMGKMELKLDSATYFLTKID